LKELLDFSFSNRRIGRFGSSTTYYLNGSIDEVKIYNRSLSTEQVGSLYAEESSGYHSKILVSQETAKYDTWQVAVTPNDIFSDGITVFK